MKYFIDQEFLSGFHKPLFGKRRHFIDLVSIGIVCEDGREYYAISNEFNPKDADDWVKQNVIAGLPQQYVNFYDSPRIREESLLYKNNAMIANDIQGFVYAGALPTIEFYGYYADYDWVLFCSLFGRMIDLPKGFPMYCIDLKQRIDGAAKYCLKNNCTDEWHYDTILHEKVNNKTPAYKNFDEALNGIKANPKYPKQTNEHNALADAKWNFELYKFLQNK